ncbi:Uncharacterized conserved protein [Janthinobacterium sp. Marseille]|nr:hypothetical protein [Janthinobacterium sp. Marseille]ABR91844.1 Uncharacterized conserved protein [Janthinobacterium sp. Marseille]
MYLGVREIFKRYWDNYGGMKALLSSFYLHISLVLTAITFPIWSKEDWWEQVLGILPNLLGFTIGGFTLFLGIGSEKFRAKLAQKQEDGSSILIQISASYVHFIVVQTIAIFSAIVAQATYSPTPVCIIDWLHANHIDPVVFFSYLRIAGWGLSYLMFLYALMLILAACMAVFRTASWSEESPPPITTNKFKNLKQRPTRRTRSR